MSGRLWRSDDGPDLTIESDRGTYTLQLWYRDDAPDHVTLNGCDFDEVDIGVDDLREVAQGLMTIAAEVNE